MFFSINKCIGTNIVIIDNVYVVSIELLVWLTTFMGLN